MSVASNNNKANQLLFDLRNRLMSRLPSWSFSSGFDANSNPVLSVAQNVNVTAGQDNVLFSVQGVALAFSNLVGSTEDFAQSPNLLNICFELSATATGATLASTTFQQVVMFEAARLYCIEQLYLSANTTRLTVANVNICITSTNLVQTVPPAPEAGNLAAS